MLQSNTRSTYLTLSHNVLTVSKRTLNKKKKENKKQQELWLLTKFNGRLSTCSEMESPLVIPLEYSSQPYYYDTALWPSNFLIHMKKHVHKR